MADERLPTLVLRSGLTAPLIVELMDGPNILGRFPQSQVDLPNPYVSRRHAMIEVTPGGSTIRDLGSKNGTYVNQASVGSAPHPLEDRDRIALGFEQVVFEFNASGRTITIGTDSAASAGPTGEVRVDAPAREVWVRGERLDPPLTAKEFDLLAFLHQRAGEACSYSDLAAVGWPERAPGDVDESEVRQYIRRLRRRIEADPGRPRHVTTMQGYGYRLSP